MSQFDAPDCPDCRARHFDAEPVSISELEEERRRTGGEMSQRQPCEDRQPQASSGRLRRNAKEAASAGNRKPKAGCYPLGFSPYSMSAKRGVISLARLVIKTDLKVTSCAVCDDDDIDPCVRACALACSGCSISSCIPAPAATLC